MKKLFIMAFVAAGLTFTSCDNKAKAPTRIGYTGEGKEKKRVSKKTGKVVD